MAVLVSPLLQFKSSRNAAQRRVWGDGDSYVGGAPTPYLVNSVRMSGRVSIGTGVGGSDIPGVAGRITANKQSIGECVLFIWDGSPNGFTSVDEYLAPLVTATAGLSRLILIPSAIPFGLGPYAGSQAETIRIGMEARWPGLVLDWRAWIGNTAGVINQDRMLNYPTDTVHLNQTAMDEMAAGIAAFIAANGW